MEVWTRAWQFLGMEKGYGEKVNGTVSGFKVSSYNAGVFGWGEVGRNNLFCSSLGAMLGG